MVETLPNNPPDEATAASNKPPDHDLQPKTADNAKGDGEDPEKATSKGLSRIQSMRWWLRRDSATQNRTHSQRSTRSETREPAKRLFWARLITVIQNITVVEAEVQCNPSDRPLVVKRLTADKWVCIDDGSTLNDGHSTFRREYINNDMGDAARNAHDDISVSLGSIPVRASYIIIKESRPRTIALHKSSPRFRPEYEPTPAEVARLGSYSIFAPYGRARRAWDHYARRKGIRGTEVVAASSDSLGLGPLLRVALLATVLLTFGVMSFFDGRSSPPFLTSFGDLLNSSVTPTLSRVTTIVALAVLLSSVSLFLLVVLIPLDRNLRQTPTVSGRWQLAFLNTSSEVYPILQPRTIRLRSLSMFGMALSIAPILGVYLGLTAADFDRAVILVAGTLALFCAAGVWSAVRRVVSPRMRWLTATVVIASAVILTQLYAGLVVSGFWYELGIPADTLTASPAQMIQATYRTVAAAMLAAIIGVLVWLSVRRLLATPIKWMAAIVLIISTFLIPMALGYTSAVWNAQAFQRGLTAEPLLKMASVCVQVVGSAQLETTRGRNLQSGVGQPALIIGRADGRSYYLFVGAPVNYLSLAGNDPSPAIRFTTVSLPTNSTAERQRFGDQDLCQ